MPTHRNENNTLGSVASPLRVSPQSNSPKARIRRVSGSPRTRVSRHSRPR